MTALRDQLPNAQPWPVTPPDEFWLHRWHWLRDDDGFLLVGSWHHIDGWLLDWSGRANPECMAGWTYVGVVREPDPPFFLENLT